MENHKIGGIRTLKPWNRLLQQVAQLSLTNPRVVIPVFPSVFLVSTAWSSVFCRFSDDWCMQTTSSTHFVVCVMSLVPSVGRRNKRGSCWKCSSV